MVDKIFQIAGGICYVAIHRNGLLESATKPDLSVASSSESDRYEELLVNPTLIKLASQRGDINCGGLDYLLVRYGHFFHFVLPTDWGQVSVCMEADAGPLSIGACIRSLVASHDSSRRKMLVNRNLFLKP